MNEMQSKLYTLTARVNEAEERISDLHDKLLVVCKKRFGEINDTTKCSNIRIIGIPKGVEREGGLEDIFQQIIAENFLIWGRKQAFESKRQK